MGKLAFDGRAFPLRMSLSGVVRVYIVLWLPSRLLRTVILTIALLCGSEPCFGQIDSGAASVALTARLESLSLAAAPLGEPSITAQGYGLRHVSVLITSFWAVPSNLTLVRAFENGNPIVSDAVQQSSGSGRRRDGLRVALPRERSRVTTSSEVGDMVTIVVQAL